MIDLIHANDYWQHHTACSQTMNLPRYLKMLEIFVETGEIAGKGVAWAEDEPWREYSDPMLQYLVRLMSDAKTKAMILGDKLCGKIFFSTVGRFVVDCIHYQQFLSQRQWTERNRMSEVLEWSIKKRTEQKAWQSLLAEIGEKHEDNGFDREFYERRFCEGKSENKENWEKMVSDWSQAADEQQRKEAAKHIISGGNHMENTLPKLLDNAHKYIEKENISQEKAVQAWQMTDGRWTETEFERNLTLVKLQDRYPQIEEVVKKMGRIADNGGNDRLAATSGRGMKIEHSSGSDIEGITVGNDINAMLPSEAALYMDDELEDTFLYKFVRRRLQILRYKSNMSKPSRHLSFHSASRKGPMIVCVDTSASMYGVPQRIVKSMLSLLEEMAERLNRDCFLIDFSVSVRAIDLMQRRKKHLYESIGLKENEYDFQRGELPFIGGGTNAVCMMNLMFQLLDNNGDRYVNADVLWVSDFLIPYPDTSYIQRMKSYRKTGTRFYGMRIVPEGTKSTEWEPDFDHIYPITYRQLRRY